jgi:hypothetical protein
LPGADERPVMQDLTDLEFTDMGQFPGDKTGSEACGIRCS